MRHYFHYCPFPYYDVEGLQLWLEDQARKGYFLSRRGFIGIDGLGGVGGIIGPFGIMVKRPPAEVRYRLISTTAHTGDDKGMYQMANELGWEEVTEHRIFLVYRTEDPSLTELHTDPQVQTLELRKVRNLSLIFLLVALAIDLGKFFADVSLLGFSEALALHGIVSYPLSLAIFLAVIVQHVVRFHRQEVKLQSGQLFNVNADWKASARRYNCWYLSLFLAYAICLITVFVHP